MSELYEIQTTTIDGNDITLDQFKGQVLLVVNVASACGLTPQYTGLQALYTKYSDRNFTVVGFPCNQFGAQEPGTEQEIADFCSTNYQVSFPMMSKIDVNGPSRHPLYDLLAGDNAKFPGDITWNFEKFLISKDGEIIQRFSPQTTPEDRALVSAVESAISE